MDRSTAQSKVRETLQNPFDKGHFIDLTKNLLNKIDESKAFQCNAQYVKEIYREYVKSYERIATYTDPNGKKIDILIVYLQKETSLERARTAQRNFVAKYLKDRAEKDAGLVAFVSPDPNDWRFSFVKMEYKFTESSGGKTKVKEEFTPAKRYSFLVGKYENSHTAQSRIAPVLMELKTNPLLEEIEDIFSVEKVTKEFFEKYRELFVELKDELDKIVKNNHKIKTDFDDKGIETADFAKKLLGQIVFLYFLQKKGWFGVGRDMDWGTGPKDFLRKLFEKQVIEYKNFFNDMLEPLFYEALAIPRTDDFYSRFNCKIPFLNGGLFDPIQGYDWVHTDIVMPDPLFSNNKRTKQGDVGTGILDVFDRYNFTVKEDEPLEKEVAVDPEMLGKVFENLLEVKDRKSKGTYYTPREIVHYMCEQSLVNYLASELEGKAGKDDIEKLIKHGEAVGENEARVKNKGEETSTYSYKLPESIRANAKLIDQKLAEIKVCDPAIGSGAFPVGMMSEIVKARNVLSSYIKGPGRTIYNFKRDCIQNSLYGVDIDPSAVDIAKLRLWLSLVVDEEDIKQIKPLPNLDYKIMQGNSLLEEFEGIKLFDEKLFIPSAPSFDKQKRIGDLKATQSELQKQYIQLHSAGKLTKEKGEAIEAEIKKISTQLKQLADQPKAKEEPGLFASISEARKKADELKVLHKQYFNASHKDEKDKIRKQIDALDWDLIETTLREQDKGSSLKKIAEFKRANVRPFFLWKLHFADVFQEKGGFDVVIGNPPYQGFRDLNKTLKEALGKEFCSAVGKYDLYIPFIEKGYYLIKSGGLLIFICPTAFAKRNYGQSIRKFIIENTKIKEFIDFEHSQIFEQATNYTGIFSFTKDIPGQNEFSYRIAFTNYCFGVKQRELTEHSWVFVHDRYKSIINKINNNTLLKNIAVVSEGVVTGLNDLYLKTSQEIKKHRFEKKYFYRCYRGRDIDKYYLRGNSELLFYPYLLLNNKTVPISEHVLQKRTPRYLGYLKENIALIKKRKYFVASSKKWYELWNQRDMSVLKSPKLITPELSDRNRFMIAPPGCFYGDTVCGIILKDKFINAISINYLAAILNSFLIEWFYKKTTVPKAGGFYIYKVMYLGEIPVREISFAEQTPFIDLVDKILVITKDDDYLENPAKQAKVRKYEKQIDQMVYKLYGLTEGEVEVVEGASIK